MNDLVSSYLNPIIVSLFANALTSLTAKLGTSGEVQDIQEMVREGIEDAIGKYKWEGPGTAEEVSLFLKSPTAEGIVRNLFSAFVTTAEVGEEIDGVRNSIEVLFIESLAYHLVDSPARVRAHGRSLFHLLERAVLSTVSAASDSGSIIALGAVEGYRHVVISDQLLSIEQSLGALRTRGKRASRDEILQFESRLRRGVAARHGTITPPHLDKATKLPITKLYIEPRFSTYVSRPWPKGSSARYRLRANWFPVDEEKLIASRARLLRSVRSSSRDENVSLRMPRQKIQLGRVIPYSMLLSDMHRMVILGDPGGGKSTFTSFLCHQLATRPGDRLFAGRELTPFHVVLRDFGAARKRKQLSLLDFMERSSRSVYQTEKPPKEALSYLLQHGHILLILDGLDELIDTSDRRTITGDIETFCGQHPETPVIVTSRQVGYNEAPLDPQRFRVVELARLDDEQVKEYASKWFGTIDELTAEQQEESAKAFVRESQIVAEVRASPLMLALMCTLYRAQGYIPRSRPQVYKKCTNMLFERDKSRGIETKLKSDAQLRPAVMHLAYWIFQDGRLQSGVKEGKLVAKTTDFLMKRHYDDRDEARQAAQAFLDFCKERAWVFTDTGTSEDGERLYQFTHRTFLEYFAARQIAREHPSPALLAKKLLPKIAKNEWDVVAQLAFQIQDINVDGATEQLVEKLLRSAATRKRGKWNILKFGMRCLEFLVPHREQTGRLIRAAIQRVEATGLPRIPEFTSSLNGLSLDNLSPAEKEIRSYVESRHRADEFEFSREVFWIELCLGMVGQEPVSRQQRHWRALGTELLSKFEKDLSVAAEKDPSLAVRLVSVARFPVDPAIDSHGFDLLLHSVETPYGLVTLMSKGGRQYRVRLKKKLEMSGPPWFSREKSQLDLTESSLRHFFRVDASVDQDFVSAVTLMAAAEAAGKRVAVRRLQRETSLLPLHPILTDWLDGKSTFWKD